MKLKLTLIAAAIVASLFPAINAQTLPGDDLIKRVEVGRTAYGVPHIRAKDLRAAGYALAWVQCEDYGESTPMSILRASGRWATVAGAERLDSDFAMKRERAKTEKKN